MKTLGFDPATHAKEGHTIEITRVPMYCVTCDLFLTDDTFENNKARVEKEKT